jgi:hypothetical protein
LYEVWKTERKPESLSNFSHERRREKRLNKGLTKGWTKKQEAQPKFIALVFLFFGFFFGAV